MNHYFACSLSIMSIYFQFGGGSRANADANNRSLRWQYHYISPYEQRSPSTGVVFRAVCSESGKELLRHYVNQNPDGTRTRLYSIVQKFDGDRVLRLSYERGVENNESLLVISEDVTGSLMSELFFEKNRSISALSPGQILQFNEARRERGHKSRSLELEQFPWVDLEGAVNEMSGSYAPPLTAAAGERAAAVVESVMGETSEQSLSVVGNDDVVFRFDIYERHGGGRRGRVYALPRRRVGELPSWNEGVLIPLTVDRAVEIALAYARGRLEPGGLPVELNSVEIHSMSVGAMADVWYYLVEVNVAGGTGDDWYPKVCVLMDGSVIEPRYLNLQNE